MSYENRRLVQHRVEVAQADAVDGFMFLVDLHPNEVLFDVSAAVTEDPTDGGYLQVWVEYDEDVSINYAIVAQFNDSAEDATLYPDLLVDSRFLAVPSKYIAISRSHRVVASFADALDGVGRATVRVVVATPAE